MIEIKGTNKTVLYFIKIYTQVPLILGYASSLFESESQNVIGYNIIKDFPSNINQEIDISDASSSLSTLCFDVANNTLVDKTLNAKFDGKLFSEWLYTKMNDISDCVKNKKVEFVRQVEGEAQKILYTGYFQDFTNDPYQTFFTLNITDLEERLKETVYNYCDTDDGKISVFTFDKDDTEGLNRYTREIDIRSITANNIIKDKWYKIKSIGNTDFTTYGASSNDIDTLFKASKNGVSGDTGAVYQDIYFKIARRQKDGEVGSITGIYNYQETLIFSDITTWLSEGSDVWYVLIFQGLPTNLLRNISYEITGDWDNITTNDIMNLLGNNTIEHFWYEFKEPLESPIDFIKEQILQPLGAYFYINNVGNLVTKINKQPLQDETLEVLDESKIIEMGILENKSDISNIINQTLIKVFYNTEEDEFYRQYFNIDSLDARGSIKRFGVLPKSALTKEWKGINKNALFASSFGTANIANIETWIELKANYIFNRFSTQIQTLKIRTLYNETKDWEIGQSVILEHSKLINWKGIEQGKQGIVNNYAEEAYIDVLTWGDFVPVDNDFNGKIIIDLFDNTLNYGTVIINMFNNSKEITARSILKHHKELKNSMPLVFWGW